jgi:hypothetical protein
MYKLAGKINQEGFLKSLFKKGFMPYQCLGELVGNSIDAKADKIYHWIQGKNLWIIDNGTGMDFDQLSNMFECYRENNANGKTIGTCGIGSKAAMVNLTNGTGEVIVYTCTEDFYLKAIFPIEKIFKEKRYDDMIKIENMTENEIRNFKAQRQELGLGQTGTTIQMPVTQDIEEVLNNNFEQKWTEDLNEKLGFIYAKFPVEMFLKTDTKTITMKKYGYLDGNDTEFYKKLIYPIKVYQHRTDSTVPTRFLMEIVKENKFVEFKPLGKARAATKISDIKISELNEYELVGTYTYTLGQRVDKEYFDPANPKMPSSATKDLCDFDKQIFSSKSDYFKHLCKPICVRNNQIIGVFDIETASKSSSARGGPESMHKIYHVRSELSYETVSVQNNILDEITKIQENKNQWQPEFPKSMIRLLMEGKELAHKEIWDYFRIKTNPHRVDNSDSVTEVKLTAPKPSNRRLQEIASKYRKSKDQTKTQEEIPETLQQEKRPEPLQQEIPEHIFTDDINVDDICIDKESNNEENNEIIQEHDTESSATTESSQTSEQNSSDQESEVETSKYYLCSEIIQFVNTKSLDHPRLIKVAKALIKPAEKENFEAMMSGLTEKILHQMISMCLQKILPNSEIILKRTLGEVEVKSSWWPF